MKTEEIITEVNKHFKIKVNGKNYVGKALSKMVGFKGLVEILEDEDLAIRICEKALECPDDVYIRKLRRGLTIRFYVD